MDSIDVPSSPPPAEDAHPSAAGELIVQNGRQGGARRALTVPLTLLGRGDDCDVRLGADGVSPWHCALVCSPAGWVVRDFPGGSGTLVNGKSIQPGQPLRDGDQLTVGPFRFQFSLPAPAETGVPEPADTGRDALRIQAAAVAAQQAALTEEEIRLQQRRMALEQQERQLAVLLEEKRNRLLEVRDAARQERAALRKERDTYERRVAEVTCGLARSRQELAAAHQQVQSDRQHLRDLQQRLKRRWHRQWAAERTAARQRQTELESQRRALEQETERLQTERAALSQFRLRFNGEAELGRRQLEEAWEELYQAQQRYQAQHEQEQAELHDRQQALARREASLSEEEARLSEQQRGGEAARARLEKELEGLEGRIRNYRRKVQEQEEEVKRLQIADCRLQIAPLPICNLQSAICNPSADDEERLATLERLAGELADQRLHLAEQCQRLAEAEQVWRRDWVAAAAELEISIRDFQAREQALAAAETDLRQRQDEAAHLRRSLESWQSRLVVEAANWKGERERLLSDVQSREALAEQRLTALAELRQRWQTRRRQQVEQLQAERATCATVRREWAGLRVEGLRRRARLEHVQRALAEKALALEQYRQECISQAADPRAAEKRLQRLRRRWAALSAAGAKELERQRQALEGEAGRVDEAAHRVEQQTVVVAAHEADLARRQAAWEEQCLLAEGEQRKLLQEMESQRRQRERCEQQLYELRDEVERLARLLLDEVGEGAAASVDRAA